MSLPIYQRVAVTDAGDVIPGAEYTVINENTGVAAPIYSDRTGATLLSAPYFADSAGTIQFFIAQGTTFRVAASGGVGTYTDRYVYGVAEAVLVQADGNVGIGVVPETWRANDFIGLQVGTGAAVYGRGYGDEDKSGLASNAYFDVSDRWQYIASKPATNYYQVSGQHLFQVASSGTAGGAISWSEAMRISSAGHITTPAQPAFHAVGSGSWVTMSSGATTYITSWGSVTERGAYFNISNGKFFAAVSGWYSFTFNTYTRANSAGAYCYPRLRLNGVSDFGWAGNIQHYMDHADNDLGTTTTVTMYMTQNDYVQAAFFASNGTCEYHHGSQTFSGYLIG